MPSSVTRSRSSPGSSNSLDRGVPGAAVLGHVGRLGRAVVGDGLDRRRRALRYVDVQVDGHHAARREGGQRGIQTGVQHGRVNAAGQVAQVGDGLLGAAVRGVDQFAGPFEVEFAPVVAGAEFFLASPSFMATATSWACVPSCRSRSMPRSRAAESSTAYARVCSSSCTRCDSEAGPSSSRMSNRSRALAARVAHGAASSQIAPMGITRKVPGKVSIWTLPNGPGVVTGSGWVTPSTWTAT